MYNETAFAALDYILDTAAYNNMKVIFTMGDNWQYEDSKRNVRLSLQSSATPPYFSLTGLADSECMDMLESVGNNLMQSDLVLFSK